MSVRSAAAFAALIVSLLSAAPGAAAERACAVTAVEGPGARIWLGGVWSPLVEGPIGGEEAVIRTGPAARAEIACDDGIVASIGLGATVKLSALAAEGPGARDVVFDLIEGIVGFVAPRRTWRRLDVRTTLAVASVRSTEWLVEAGPESASVFVREGAVAVAARDGADEVVLRAGEGVDVGPAGLGETRVWGASRIAEAGARIGFGWR